MDDEGPRRARGRDEGDHQRADESAGVLFPLEPVAHPGHARLSVLPSFTLLVFSQSNLIVVLPFLTAFFFFVTLGQGELTVSIAL